MIKIIRAVLIICINAWLVLPVYAAEEDFWVPSYMPSSLAIGTLFDKDGSRSFRLHWDQALPYENRFALVYDRSQVATSETITMNNFQINIESSPLQVVRMGLGFERWGNWTLLHTDTYHGKLEWSSPRWRVLAQPSVRIINRHANSIDSIDAFRAYSRGLHLEAKLYFLDTMRIYLAHAQFYYDQDPSSLANTRDREVLLFSPLILQQAQGFETHRSQAGVSYLLPQIEISFDWRRSISAIDKNRYTYASISILWEFANRWVIQAQ
ncbi:MAG: hypothetical protein OEZ58_07550, partial [Gammaproteobacteria bacterium]|nr:hypothetical protein [Gammaproteobacteria bacterium]